MILIFDLDETLYPEITYVESGFEAVAHFLTKSIDMSEEAIHQELVNILNENGRGKTFDILLRRYELHTKKLVQKCVSQYRGHLPNIALYDDAIRLLDSLQHQNLYLVTDGNKAVQQNKIVALNLDVWFKKIFITHRYGVKSAKPSLYCFEKIKQMEKCEWEDLIYVGDNPHKDFVNLKKMEAKTVRIMRGEHSGDTVADEYDADFKISSLDELTSIFRKIENEKDFF